MKQLIIMLCIILLSTTLVYSKGSNEITDFDIAKTLIEEKKYDEAIKLLYSFSVDNPESIYEVQELVDEIKIKREEINALTEELIIASFEEGNSEKMESLTLQLEELNPFPDKLSKQFIKDAKSAAINNLNRQRFTNLMNEALDYLNSDEYALAIDKYLLCMDFHRDEFDLLLEDLESEDENISNEVIEEVDLNIFDEDKPLKGYYTTLRNESFKEIDLLNSNTLELKNYLIALKESIDRANEIVDADIIDLTDLEDSLELFKLVPEILDKNIETINKIDSYNDLFSKLTVKGSKSKFLTYSSLTLNGRVNQTEGIFYVINSLYPKYIDSLLGKIESKIDKDFTQSLAYYNNGQNTEAQISFSNTITSLKALENSASLNDLLTENSYYLGDASVGIKVMNSYVKLLNYKIELEELENNTALLELREYLEDQVVIVDKENSLWDIEKISVNESELLTYKKAPSWIDNIQNEYSNVRQNYIDREISILDTLSRLDYIAIFNFDVSEVPEDSDAVGDTIKIAAIPIDKEEDIQVFFDINNTDERTLPTFYPQIALDDLTDIENDYGKFIVKLEEYRDLYRDEKDYIFTNSSFNSRFQSITRSLELANVNRDSLVTYKTKAVEKITLSKESENRGVVIYENALQAFERENFTQAREYIETGKEVSEIAISYSRNSYVIDELIPNFYNLNGQIAKEEARIVIREVRKLITLGKTQYLEGAYIPASDLFREAELKWSETNVDSHPEIPYWLALIKDALAIESGRYLNLTDPLYNILAGYLSFAENYYRNGIKEVNKVNKLKSFAIADNYLTKVLEVKPLNERARLLQLQVLKSKDPDAFKVIFNNDFIKYRNDVIKALENVKTIDSGRVLAILAAYEEIVVDAYRANPRLSGSQRRILLERFYTPISTTGKSQTQINKERSDNEENKKSINDAYTRFKDLYRIAESEQKGLVLRLINLSEVALGFRRLPVDISNIRESNSIFILAQTRLENTDKTDIDELNSILVDVQRASALNPNSNDIPVFNDVILNLLGKETIFQLSTADDKLYREAEKDFINGDYFDARDKIILILKANSKNKNYPKLKELINRVEIKIKVEITI